MPRTTGHRMQNHSGGPCRRGEMRFYQPAAPSGFLLRVSLAHSSVRSTPTYTLLPAHLSYHEQSDRCRACFSKRGSQRGQGGLQGGQKEARPGLWASARHKAPLSDNTKQAAKGKEYRIGSTTASHLTTLHQGCSWRRMLRQLCHESSQHGAQAAAAASTALRRPGPCCQHTLCRLLPSCCSHPGCQPSVQHHPPAAGLPYSTGAAARGAGRQRRHLDTEGKQAAPQHCLHCHGSSVQGSGCRRQCCGQVALDGRRVNREEGGCLPSPAHGSRREWCDA